MNLLDGNLGIPRVLMPQLAGFPAPGSKAALLERDPTFGGVDLGAVFWERLMVEGHRMVHYKEHVSRLHATQSELNMEKVNKLVELIKAGKMTQQCLYITSDLHVVDGHHRWAAYVLAGIDEVPVSRCDDLDSYAMLDEARRFEREWGPFQ